MTPTRRLLVAVAIASLMFAGCRDGADESSPQRRPADVAPVPTTVDNPAYHAIADALRSPGNLAVCSQRSGPGDASGSYEQRVFTVAVGACPPEQDRAGTTVAVDAYDSTTIRDDSAAVDFGGRLAAWTHLQLVISVSDGAPPEVVSGVERAMAALGAEKTYDERFPARASG